MVIRPMGPLSKYWEILRIDPGGDGCGYKKQLLPLASEFFQAEFPELMGAVARSHPSPQQHRSVQTSLHIQFSTQASPVDLQSLAQAGLCLRCYVSYAILKTCKKLASLFWGTGQFTYRDLLPYVLNDDGRQQIVCYRDGKQQWVVARNGESQQATYPLFTVEVLRKFNPNAQSTSSLDTWVYHQTRQNKDLKDFLAERGLSILSDWAILNRFGTHKLEALAARDRHLITAFLAVYRRDRRKQPQNRGRRCPDPTPNQLQEMQQRLQLKGVTINDPQDLQQELKQLAQLLRQHAVWNSNGMPQSTSLEEIDPRYGIAKEFSDPNSTNNLDQIAQQELSEFCRQQLIACLDFGIAQGIREHIHNLKQRPRYAVFAPNVIAILKLVYCEGQSQSKIAAQLDMTNQAQVSRVLNPTTLLNRVRYWTVTQFFQILSVQVRNLNLATISTDPDYLNTLMQHIEVFFDEEVFQAAAAELKTAKNRSMSSLYAQCLRHYIENY